MTEIKDRNEPTTELFNAVQDADLIQEQSRTSEDKRNLAAFWIFGLCTYISYIIMLTAAYDILEPKRTNGHNLTAVSLIQNETTVPGMILENAFTNRTHLIPYCNPIGTGAVLLAATLPCFSIKLTAPFIMQRISYCARILTAIIFSAAAFLIVAVSQIKWLSIIGVVCSSISLGLGEITFLSLASHFQSDVLSTWSSGTGAAGIVGALLYTGLINLGLSQRDTLFLMLTFTIVWGCSYFVLLVKPKTVTQRVKKGTIAPNLDDDDDDDVDDDDAMLITENKQSAQVRTDYSFKEKLILVTPLLKYMVPFALVYLFEYFINQAFFELLYFPNIFLVQREQYRWYQVLYQTGVFISRSSVYCFHTEQIWVFPILQGLVLIVLLLQILVHFLSSIWIVFFIILFEGLLGGTAYANTCYTVITNVKVEEREFSMGVASAGDSVGIVMAGLISVPVHNFLCSL